MDSSRLHPQLTRLPKKSTELQPERSQAQHMKLSLHKSHCVRVQSLKMVRPTLCLPPRNIYYMKMQTSSKVLELYQVDHTTKKLRLLQTSPAPNQISAIGNAVCLQSRVRQTSEGRHHHRSA